MRISTFAQEFTRVIDQTGVTAQKPLPVPLTEKPWNYAPVPEENPLPLALDYLPKTMELYGNHGAWTDQTRWGIGRYNTEGSTKSVVFDEIEGRPDDRVTIEMDHVGLARPNSRSDSKLRRIYNKSPGSRTDSFGKTSSGFSFTYDAGSSARVSQLVVLNPTWGNGKDHSMMVGIYHMLLSTAFIRQIADAVGTDGELNRLAEICEMGARGEYLGDGIAYLNTERDPSYETHYDAAFFYAVDVKATDYAQPVHPLITSLIDGAARLIPNLTVASEN